MVNKKDGEKNKPGIVERRSASQDWFIWFVRPLACWRMVGYFWDRSARVTTKEDLLWVWNAFCLSLLFCLVALFFFCWPFNGLKRQSESMATSRVDSDRWNKELPTSRVATILSCNVSNRKAKPSRARWRCLDKKAKATTVLYSMSLLGSDQDVLSVRLPNGLRSTATANNNSSQATLLVPLQVWPFTLAQSFNLPFRVIVLCFISKCH